ncbi:hypothetical protein [Pseudonocardia sp. MH-G8]|uniref:hypothetical protein n=1 Tax=Pseudonocardia sp. MH-G8 TaxID=1854588 RepID=UPI000BA13E04|nr:hypothetical protein [Pseudonocardia sp. MH-G8]OZM80190.1 hypothetical protein CFP66_21800 [Pseudonocardia sp. MH-G8]
MAARRGSDVGFASPGTRLYLIATHSGITLAPLLADYAPDRLIGKSITDFPKFATLHFPAQQ